MVIPRNSCLSLSHWANSQKSTLKQNILKYQSDSLGFNVQNNIPIEVEQFLSDPTMKEVA